MLWNSRRRKRRKHGRTQSADTKKKNSASCRTAASREPPPKRPHKKYNNPTYSISDYETENTHTAGSRTFEQATTEINRRTKGIRFPPLLQALRNQEGKRHEHLHRVRTFVEERPRPRGHHLRMHLPTLRHGVGNVAHPKERFQRYGVFLHRHHLQAVPSGTFLFRQFPIQGRTTSRVFRL